MSRPALHSLCSIAAIFFMPSISIADDESSDVKIFNGDETCGGFS
jgi:hypothetical protein